MANDVVIDIVANDKTKKAFGSVKSGLVGIGKVAVSTVAKVAKIGAAFAAAAGASAIALTKMSMSAIDNLSKTASKIGVTTEALVGLQHAAELTGVSTDTMNMALQRLTRRVSEAAEGTGEAVGALRELGLDAREMENLPLDEQMNRIADAMLDVESQSDKVRLAMKLFDSEGVALVNTMKNGSAGLKEFAKETQALGLAVSEVDAAKIEAANDAITRAKGVFTGLGNQLAIAFAPAIAFVADMFRQAALDQNEFGNVGQRVANVIVGAVGRMMDGWKAFRVLLLQVKAVFYEFGAAAVEALRPMASALDTIIEAWNPLANFFGMDVMDPNNERTILGGTKALTEKAVEARQEVVALLEAMNPSDELMEKFNALTANFKTISEESGTATEKMNKWQSQFINAQQEGEKKADEFNQATTVGRTKLVLEEGSKQLAAFKGQSKKMFAVQKAAAIATAIINTAESVTKTMAAYPFPIDVALSALSLAAGMAQVSAIKSQSFLGGGFTGYGARAGGVDGKGGMPAIVHPNETIIDHQQGGSVGVTQNINIQTGVAQTVRAEIQNLLPEIVEISKAAIIDSNQRGGSFRNGLLGT